MNLSKSAYLKGLQCHKALWLSKHKKELATKSKGSALKMGNIVGKLAQGLFSGGVLVEFDGGNFAGMIAKTQQLLNTESMIYEATFSSNGMLVVVVGQT